MRTRTQTRESSSDHYMHSKALVMGAFRVQGFSPGHPLNRCWSWAGLTQRRPSLIQWWSLISHAVTHGWPSGTCLPLGLLALLLSMTVGCTWLGATTMLIHTCGGVGRPVCGGGCSRAGGGEWRKERMHSPSFSRSLSPPPFPPYPPSPHPPLSFRECV